MEHRMEHRHDGTQTGWNIDMMEHRQGEHRHDGTQTGEHRHDGSQDGT